MVTDPAVLAAVRRNHPSGDFTTVCYECERAVEAAREIIEADVAARFAKTWDWRERAALIRDLRSVAD